MQQPSAPSAPYQAEAAPDWHEARMQRLQGLAAQYEIRLDWVAKLRQLESFSIAVLCDDSGSMATPCAGGGATAHNPYSRQPTRWDELRNTVTMLVQLVTALDAQGSVDIFFLNRPPLMGVTDVQQVGVAFSHPPQGFTPLTRVFCQILQTKQQVLAEKRMLLLIATDGQPTDDAGTVRIAEFLQALQHKPANLFVQIMAMTDDESAMAYLNEADKAIPQLDVTDDFVSERAEILRAQGQNFHFTFGDYICKALLGPIDRYFDTLDGSFRGPGGGGGSGGGDCCTIA